MALTLRQIEVFLDLAESLHFSRTAANLGIPQPAVSRSVRALEKALGVDLFRRHTRSVQLTQAGQAFKTAAGDTLEHLERAVERARSAATGQLGQLRIAFMEFAVEGGFPGRLKAFKNACPQVSVDTRSSYTDKIIEDIGRGAVDIGFVVGPVRRDGIATRTIHRHRYVAVLPPDHRLAGKRSLALPGKDRSALPAGRVFPRCSSGSRLEREYFRLCQGRNRDHHLRGKIACPERRGNRHQTDRRHPGHRTDADDMA